MPKNNTKEKKEEKQKCRVCGCTDERACKGGCHWVAFDLCNVCQAWREEKINNSKITPITK